MNITTESSQELWHDIQEPGAYEWWYFDAEDRESGLSLVLIWFSGFPFSPYYTTHYENWKNQLTSELPLASDYAGFSFQLYENGVETLNFIREGGADLFESSRTDIGVRFEKNRFSFNPLTDEYTLDIDFVFPARRKALKASLLFKACQRVVYEKKDSNNHGEVPLHQWLLSVPKADVQGSISITEQQSGKLRTIPVRAIGYHDHNFGAVPMQEYISRWYWGRAFSDAFDLIYYANYFRSNEYQPLTLLLLHDNERETATIYDTVKICESNFRKGFFSPRHSMNLALKEDRVFLEIHNDRVLDAGPFYLRFSSEISLQVDGRNIEGIRGISEFLDPVRLQSKFMRFFTRSRIWRDGECSVMYKTYNGFKRFIDWNNR